MVCSKCKTKQSPENFAWKNKAKRQRSTRCRSCQRHYSQSHYATNREAYLKRARVANARNRKTVRTFLIDRLKESACVDCGEDDPRVLDFDHVDPSTKKFGVAQATRRNATITMVKKELKKCETRCANCHRKRTYDQFGWSDKFA